MIAELGNFALALGLAISVLLAVFPLWGAEKGNKQLMSLARPMTYGLFICLTFAFGALFYAFAVNDFSIQYVVNNSNSRLPLQYRLSAVWGAHEGSLLLWIWLLSVWSVAVSLFSRQLPQEAVARVLGIMGLVTIGFLIFILFTSNPFARTFPNLPIDGKELNPMLQDVGLIFHPPLLYMGYVGFSVAFAFSIASLMTGKLDTAWARWSRPWTMAAWVFLTVGIVLGSWWAYYELGWGGWWFWDPVENASLMPWLIGLALLHSLIVTEQRGIFSYWTILFSLFAFAFSLLGTFIVRSGVLTSVHAFAVDGERGTALLLIFFLLTALALTVFALKVNLRQSAVRFSVFSKESFLLLANVVLTIATVSVFLGTFYPMVFSAMGWGSISVGAPYFNSIFVPLLLIVLIAMVFVLATKWQKMNRTLLRQKSILLIPALLIAYLIIHFTVRQDESLRFHFSAFVLLSLAIWLLLATLWINWRKIGLRRSGMILAHCGVAFAVIGAVMSGYFGSEIGVRLAPQQSQMLNGYEFRYIGFTNELGPNFTSEKAHFEIYKNNQKLTALYPERRYYEVRTMNMSEVGIQWGVLGDIYIVMGDKLAPNEFSFRLHYKPFVRWLWLGGILMALGALVAAVSLVQRKNAMAFSSAIKKE